MVKSNGDEPSNLARAMWVFLGYMLVGPFFAGLAVAASLILFPALGLERLLPQPLPALGPAAVTAFIWSAIPAALAAFIVLPKVLRTGRFGWIEAAVGGVVGFAATAVVTGAVSRELLPWLSFLAGLVSIGVQRAMASGNVIAAADS